VASIEMALQPSNADAGPALQAWRTERGHSNCLGARSLLIAGVVRNCAKTLAPTVERLAACTGSDTPLKWLLIESDSNDDTLAELARLTRQVPDFRYLSMGTLSQYMPARAERIAFSRNAYLLALEHDPAYTSVSHLIVADFDGVNDMLARPALASCWSRNDWDACMANQAAPYYDIWALRHPTWCPDDCWARYRAQVAAGQNPQLALKESVRNRMVQISCHGDWVEVDSAFGGLAIYRRDAVAGQRYRGLDEHGREVCEHVSLHKTMREAGRRLFINPALINTGFTDHTECMRQA
jgi:hypothetical protein